MYILAVFVFLILFLVILTLSGYGFLHHYKTEKEFSPPAFKWEAKDGETYTILHISIRNEETAGENRELCYDLIYIPDKSVAGDFVRRRYATLKFDSGGNPYNFWGEEYIGRYGYSEFDYLYRTNGNDKIIIKFYDGTNVTKDLMKAMEVYYNIKNSNHSEAVYDCYFDGVLKASNLTYEQLKNHVCDDWKRICKR